MKCTPEYNDKTRRMMDELEALKVQAKEVTKNIARERALNKQSDAMREKIAAGDTSRPPKREKPVYDEQVVNARLERDRLKRKVDELVAKGDRISQSRAKKLLTIRNDLQMAMILASRTVFEHLAYAVGGGHVGSLLGDATRSVARHIPGVKGISEKSPRYGEGLSWEAFKNRAQGLKEAPMQAWNQLRHGAADREIQIASTKTTDEFYTNLNSIADAIRTPGALNKVMETTRAVAGYIGRTHAATKEFLTQPEFLETVGRETRALEKSMEKAGAKPEQIAEFMSRESTQSTLASKGVAQAYTEKMQGKNSFNSAVDSWVGALERSNSLGANVLASLFKAVEPIRKIGMNIADRQVSNLAGAGRALLEVAKKGEMTPERADKIMFNIGRQGVGAVMLAVGALYYTKTGGVPGVFSKKDQPQLKDAAGNQIKPGESEMLPASAFHGDVAALVQIGASMMQVYAKEHGKEHGLQLALDVLGKPTYNWFERAIPYTDTARRISNTLEYGRNHGKDGNPWGEVLGNILRSHVVPGFLQHKAFEDDPYKGFRKPRNVKEDVMLGIPGQREKVPK